MLLKFKILVSVILLSVPTLSMESSSDGRSFETQEDLNRFVGKRSVELYSQLNACSRYPNLQKNEFFGVPGDYWDVGAADGKVVMVKKTPLVKASVALGQIFHNTENLLDCVMARTIVIAHCLQEILGNHLFDTLYGACEEKLSFNKNNNLLFLNNFCSLFCIKKNLTIKDFSQTGGLVCINNLPNYLKVNPDGFYSNDNLVSVVNDDNLLKYIGFGEDYINGPISYNDVKSYMLAAYHIGYQADEDQKSKLKLIQGQFDAIQNTPVSTLSLEFIKIAQTEKNLEHFLCKTNQG